MNPVEGTNSLKVWTNSMNQYDFPWDIPGELIQGAVRELAFDSEDEHWDSIEGSEWQIKLKIDYHRKTIEITDLGRGFKDFSWLAMGESSHLKEGREDTQSGFGIGLSAILARSDFFQITTGFYVDEDFVCREITYKHFHKNLLEANNQQIEGFEVDTKSLFDPDKIEEGIEPLFFKDEQPISFTRIRLGGNDGFLPLWNFIENSGPQSLFESLDFHTAFGLTHNLFDKKFRPVDYIVELVFGEEIDEDGGIKFDVYSVQNNLGFKYDAPIKSPVFTLNTSGENSGEPSSKHFMYWNKRGRNKDPDTPTFDSFAFCAIGPKGEAISGRDKLLQNFPGFIAWSNNLEDENQLHNSQIFLSIDGFLQPFRITPPVTRSNMSINPWYFAIINCDRNIVEQGRNAIRPEFKSYLNAEIKNILYKFHNTYTSRKSGESSTKKTKERQKVSNAFKKKPLGQIIAPRSQTQQSRLPLVIPTRETVQTEEHQHAERSYDPLLKKIPERESETLAVFIDLCSGGHIEGIQFSEIGDNHRTYDLVVIPSWPISSMGEDHVNEIKKFIKKNGDMTYSEELTFYEFLKEALYAECKFEVSALAQEINEAMSRKEMKQISFLVAWQQGRIPDGWEFRRCVEQEKFHASANYVLENMSDRNISTPVILLSDYFDSN